MPDKMRWRYGDTNPVVAAVDRETVIEIGDLVWQDIDDAKPASDFSLLQVPDHTALSRVFLGIAMQCSRAGDTCPIRVASTGVFEMDCPAGMFELGDLLGFADNGDRPLNQQVAKVADPRSAIARVAKREPIPITTVLVDIRSTVMTGGILPHQPPRGIALPVTVDLQSDVSQFTAAIDELTQLCRSSNLCLQAFQRTFGLEDWLPKLVRFEQGPAPKGTVLILLKPSDRLLDFLAAARAGDLQGKFID